MHHKLATYSLNRNHAKGGPKAYLFERLLGITLADVDRLAAEIAAGVLRIPISGVRENPPYGVGCEVLVPVAGVGFHHEHVMPVTTGWELRYNGDRPRLVTAYIEVR